MLLWYAITLNQQLACKSNCHRLHFFPTLQACSHTLQLYANTNARDLARDAMCLLSNEEEAGRGGFVNLLSGACVS